MATPSDDAQAPGWYQAEGDPAGSVRYWDGHQWQGDALPIAAVTSHRAPPTPDGMPAGLEPGSPWQRIAGKLIDDLLVFAPFFGVGSVIGGGEDPGAVSLAFMGVMLVVMALYDLVMVGMFATTAGKAAMGLRVVGPTGDDADWDIAVRRWMLSLVIIVPIVGVLAVVVIGIISLVFLFSDPCRQTVHDRVAGSFVVTTESARRARAGGRSAQSAGPTDPTMRPGGTPG